MALRCGNAAQQHDDFRQHQFRHAARVRERRVKDGNAAVLRGVEIHLVGADAKTADRRAAAGACSKNARGQTRVRADADEVGVLDATPAASASGKRLGMIFDIAVAIPAESFHSARMNAFEQQDFDLSFMK